MYEHGIANILLGLSWMQSREIKANRVIKTTIAAAASLGINE